MMKKLVAAAAALLLPALALAQFQQINIGVSANDGTGDPIRTAFGKDDSNWTLAGTTLVPALSGDVSTPGVSNVVTIMPNAVTNAKMAQMLANSIKCNATGSAANGTDCSVATILTLITSTSGGGTTNYLRADGTWAAPAGGGGGGYPTLSVPGGFSNTGSGTAAQAILASGTSGGLLYYPNSTTTASTGAFTANQILMGQGAGQPPASLGSSGTTSLALIGNASGFPSWGLINLASMVTGIDSAAHGGTGVNNPGTITDGANVIFSGSGQVTFVVPNSTTSYTMPAGGGNVGTLELLQNAKSTSYTLLLTDDGKHIYNTSTSPVTFTIPANSSVPYPIGTALTFVNSPTGGTVSIAITTDTMYLSPLVGTTGTRSLAPLGVATALKIDATHWVISGSGLTKLIAPAHPMWESIGSQLGSAANDCVYANWHTPDIRSAA